MESTWPAIETDPVVRSLSFLPFLTSKEIVNVSTVAVDGPFACKVQRIGSRVGAGNREKTYCVEMRPGLSPQFPTRVSDRELAGRRRNEQISPLV
jgi:hypothetical protein